MTSTHSANPLCVAAAVESLEALTENRQALIKRAAATGVVLQKALQELAEKYENVGHVPGRGLVYGLDIVTDRKSRTPQPELAARVVEEAYHRGLLLFAPVGQYSNIIKLNPPLIITEEAALEIAAVIGEALAAARK